MDLAADIQSQTHWNMISAMNRIWLHVVLAKITWEMYDITSCKQSQQ